MQHLLSMRVGAATDRNPVQSNALVLESGEKKDKDHNGDEGEDEN